MTGAALLTLAAKAARVSAAECSQPGRAINICDRAARAHQRENVINKAA